MTVNVARVVDVAEVTKNLRALLALDPDRWGLAIERQILSQLLPRISGPRKTLELPLWDLLLFCLEGPTSPTPEMTDEVWEQACMAAANGTRLSTPDKAAFPRAAAEVGLVLVELKEVGIYPAPKVDSA